MSDQFLAALDAQIAARHLLTHPFYVAWTKGELTKEALADYATQYYRHVAAFPTYLSAVHSRCGNEVTRRHLLQNLHDEEAGEPNHPGLWRRFAQALGVSEARMTNSETEKETNDLVATFRANCSSDDTAEGLATLYAYESQIPAVSETKIDGLKKFYGMNDPQQYEYFSVHVEADREHAAVERDLLRKHVREENFPAVSRAVDRALEALWGLLAGVCRRHSIAC